MRHGCLGSLVCCYSGHDFLTGLRLSSCLKWVDDTCSSALTPGLLLVQVSEQWWQRTGETADWVQKHRPDECIARVIGHTYYDEIAGCSSAVRRLLTLSERSALCRCGTVLLKHNFVIVKCKYGYCKPQCCWCVVARGSRDGLTSRECANMGFARIGIELSNIGSKAPVSWSEVRWAEVRWDEMRWGEMRWGEVSGRSD